MHHDRGTLRDGDAVRLDPANVSIQYLDPRAAAPASWNGYLVVPSQAAVQPGGTYTLHLEDGRSGELRIDHLTADDSGQFRATLIGHGPLK